MQEIQAVQHKSLCLEQFVDIHISECVIHVKSQR